MTVLPVVERELRVAARKRGTHGVRLAAAGGAVMLMAAVLFILSLQAGTVFARMGLVLFEALKWLGFAAVSAAGLFLTADCLSEEKRRGTLGLLFLTDLRGYDIVLGKLAATSLRACFGLLAVFPVVAVVFLMGGVSAGQYGRVLLVLGNTLFLSLSLGLCISAVSRDAQRALTGTLLATFVCFVLTCLVDLAWSDWDPKRFAARCSYVSPLATMLISAQGNSGEYWLGLGATHALGWLGLALASFSLPRRWQDRVKPQRGRQAAERSAVPLRPPAPEVRPGPIPAEGGVQKAAATGGARPSKLRPRWQREALLERNPVAWLAGRDRWLFWVLRLLVVGTVLLVAALLWFSEWAGWATQVGQVMLGFVTLVLVLWFASQASRFFVEAQQTGMMELLLSTPLTSRQIVGGHGRQLAVLFAMPVVLLLAANLSITGVSIATKAPQAQAAVSGIVFQAMTAAGGAVTYVTGLLALGWFGMWMGLRSRSPGTALLKTVFFVKVAPWFALVFAQGLLIMVVAFKGAPPWTAPLMNLVLGVGVDLALVALARRRVLEGLRDRRASGSIALATR